VLACVRIMSGAAALSGLARAAVRPSALSCAQQPGRPHLDAEALLELRMRHVAVECSCAGQGATHRRQLCEVGLCSRQPQQLQG
jgi:hypothetical protein